MAALAATWAGAAMSQDYPMRRGRIVTSPAGGGSDQAARLVAHGLSPLLGQQVIVDDEEQAGIDPRQKCFPYLCQCAQANP